MSINDEIYDIVPALKSILGDTAVAAKLVTIFEGLTYTALDGRYHSKVTAAAANPDTSGAVLGDLEVEVNEIKAALRSAGIIAT